MAAPLKGTFLFSAKTQLQCTAFRFNGTNNYVVVPNSPSLQATDSLTIKAWVNIPGAQDSNIVMKGNYGYGLKFRNSGGCLTGTHLNFWVDRLCGNTICSTGIEQCASI